MATEKRLIDANVFWESVTTDFWEHFTQCHDTDQVDLMEMIHDNLTEQPTVDAVEVVHGRWKLSRENEVSKTVYCTHCGEGFYFAKKGALNIDKMPYCPNCGAKMDGGTDNG